MTQETPPNNPFQTATRVEDSQARLGDPRPISPVNENPTHKLIWTVVGGLLGIIFPGLLFNFVLLIFRLAGAFNLIALLASIVIGAAIARKLYSQRQRRKARWK